MLFVESVRLSLGRYVDFAGRSQRREYWWFLLFSFVVSTIASRLEAELALPFADVRDGFLDGAGLVSVSRALDLVPTFVLVDGLSSLVALALFIPGLAVAVRRLHDLDMSGWWLLIVAVPFIGAVVLIIFFVQPGMVGTNRFGPDPRLVDPAPGAGGIAADPAIDREWLCAR